MPNSLPELEAERSKILRQFTTLSDLRTGSICAVPRRCGKPTCHCAKPNDPGHDPQIRLTRKVEGKTVAESFPSPAAWRKAQSEIDEYHRFQKLSTELITVNEKICRHRPIEYVTSPFSPQSAEGKCRVPTTCAHTVALASSPPTSNWTSKTRSSLLECAACRQSWARKLPSIMAASRCNCSPVWR